jgi:hypothetical protein
MAFQGFRLKRAVVVIPLKVIRTELSKGIITKARLEMLVDEALVGFLGPKGQPWLHGGIKPPIQPIAQEQF